MKSEHGIIEPVQFSGVNGDYAPVILDYNIDLKKFPMMKRILNMRKQIAPVKLFPTC